VLLVHEWYATETAASRHAKSGVAEGAGCCGLIDPLGGVMRLDGRVGQANTCLTRNRTTGERGRVAAEQSAE